MRDESITKHRHSIQLQMPHYKLKVLLFCDEFVSCPEPTAENFNFNVFVGQRVRLSPVAAVVSEK